MIRSSDITFARELMRMYEIPRLSLTMSNSQRKHPDIWVSLGEIPIITVTREWARQITPERQKRLLHEILHITGLQHGRIGRYTYSTYPDKDTYSNHMYLELLKGKHA